MPVVDAQVHIWGAGPPTVPVHRQLEVYPVEQLLAEMDEAGVDAAIIHPPSWDPSSNELAVEAVRQHPNRFAILGNFPLDRPESRALVDGWRERPGMVGLRFTFFHPGQESWPTDGTLDWLWAAAERAGLPIALLADHFLPAVGQIAERHPGLRLIVDHLGGKGGRTGEVRDAAAFAHLPDLLALARHPNVAVKATGAPGYAGQPYPYPALHPILERIFDAFGPRRFFWGSDITRMPCTYRQVVTLFAEELPWLKGRDKELVMGEAVCDWLGWQPSVYTSTL
jgi:predicted TIM-barrel fold metal-dependent hydrolase